MGEFPAVVNGRVLAGAACWTLSVAVFVVQAIAQAASTVPYSMATNLISDLGVTTCGPSPQVCSPLHGLVNGTFVAVGLLHTIGAVATYPAWPRTNLTRAGLGQIAFAGTGLMLAGLAPENVAPTAHALGALYGIVALNLGMTLLGLTLLRGAARALGTVALAAGIAGIAGTVLFLTATPAVPPGTAERLADYPATAMLVVLGAALVGSAIATPANVGRS